MAHAHEHPPHDHPAHHAAGVPPRQRLLAQRLLRGEGSVSLTAYRAGETLSSAVHGVSADGRIVVAHVPNLFGSLGAFHTPEPIEVRMDVTKDALDLALPARVASVHLLGTLTWARDTDDVAALGVRGRVADLAHDVGPRVRVGVVESERILLHDAAGVTVFCPHTLPLSAGGRVAPEELAALADDVLGTPGEVLADLADAVVMGLLPGEEQSVAGQLPDATSSPARVLDADERGVTLLRMRGDETSAVHVPLPGAERMEHSPRHAWRGLLAAIPARVSGPVG